MFLLVPFVSGCAAALFLGGFPQIFASAKITLDAARAAEKASEAQTQFGLRVLEHIRNQNLKELSAAVLAVRGAAYLTLDDEVEVDVWPLVGTPLRLTEGEHLLLVNEAQRMNKPAYMAALFLVLLDKQDERAQQA